MSKSIKEYIRKFDKPFDIVQSEYSKEFNQYFNEEKRWLCNLEEKLQLLENQKIEKEIEFVIQKIKSLEKFSSNDTENLSVFVSRINKVINLLDRLNNFKEGTLLENGSKLKLYELFNKIIETNNFNELNIKLNKNLNKFLPHLYSLIKHFQNPTQYPLYYKYWKNVMREVLKRKDDYSSMRELYLSFPKNERHLNFASYFGAIGIKIIDNLNNFNTSLTTNSPEYKFLKKKLFTLERFENELDKKVFSNDEINQIAMKKEFEKYLKETNKEGSNKADSYIRAIEFLNNINERKSIEILNGFDTIYQIESIEVITKLHKYILEQQKDKNGLFKNEEPISYWRDRFYSAAIKNYLNFLNFRISNPSNEMESNKNNSLLRFQKDCTAANLTYTESLITRYIASLVTKPFVLLSGLSGSGKTKLAQSFAQWICEDTSQYCIVPVGADWTNREPLLGYVNALQDSEYILPENGALQLLMDANENYNGDTKERKPYFLILDEMNLSHVERYFADFLSVMESKDPFKLHSDKDALKSGVPHQLAWPKNLFVVGTVNIDETTYMFSPKVLDRANVIEFRVDANEMKTFLKEAKEVGDLKGSGKAMGSSLVEISKEKSTSNSDNLQKALNGFFEELQKVGAEFGYRTASEIQTLFGQLDVVNPSYISEENKKIDIAMMQKLLPKLHGSRRKLLKTLEVLAQKCLDKKQQTLFDDRGVYKIEDDNEIKYKLSFEKIARMYKNAIENGFASYAEA